MVNRDPPLRIGFYNALIGFIVFTFLTLFFGIKDTWTLPNINATSVMLVSGFIWALTLFCFLEAFYFTESHVIATIALFLPVFTETFNWAINQAPLKWSTAIGSLIMGIGGIIVIATSYYHDKKNQKKSTNKQFKIPESIDDL